VPKSQFCVSINQSGKTTQCQAACNAVTAKEAGEISLSDASARCPLPGTLRATVGCRKSFSPVGAIIGAFSSNEARWRRGQTCRSPCAFSESCGVAVGVARWDHSLLSFFLGNMPEHQFEVRKMVPGLLSYVKATPLLTTQVPYSSHGHELKFSFIGTKLWVSSLSEPVNPCLWYMRMEMERSSTKKPARRPAVCLSSATRLDHAGACANHASPLGVRRFRADAREAPLATSPAMFSGDRLRNSRRAGVLPPGALSTQRPAADMNIDLDKSGAKRFNPMLVNLIEMGKTGAMSRPRASPRSSCVVTCETGEEPGPRRW